MAGRRSNRRVSSKAAEAAAIKRRRNTLWMGGIAGAFVIAIVLVGALIIQSPSTGVTGAVTDETVPNFEITLYQGEDKLGSEKLNFANLQGKPIVLNFWAGLCPPCRAEMPGFQRFYDDTKDDVLLVGIDVGQFTGLGNRRNAQDLLQELGVSYPAGFTNDRGVMRDYQVRGMPTTVFINSDGEIVQNWTGPLSEDSLRAFTEALLLADDDVTS